MSISGMIIPAGDVLFVRSTNHFAQDKGLDFNQTEGPCHE